MLTYAKREDIFYFHEIAIRRYSAKVPHRDSGCQVFGDIFWKYFLRS